MYVRARTRVRLLPRNIAAAGAQATKLFGSEGGLVQRKGSSWKERGQHDMPRKGTEHRTPRLGAAGCTNASRGEVWDRRKQELPWRRTNVGQEEQKAKAGNTQGEAGGKRKRRHQGAGGREDRLSSRGVITADPVRPRRW